jgi:hypothetical protein
MTYRPYLFRHHHAAISENPISRNAYMHLSLKTCSVRLPDVIGRAQ